MVWMRPVPVLGFVCALAVMWASLCAFGGGASAAPSIEELTANVRKAAGVRPAVMGFRQDISLQVLFLRWRFYADVVRRGDELELTVHDAPGFLDGDVSASLLELSEGLDNFDLRLVDEIRRNNDVIYVLEGTSRIAGGARSGRIWVNARTWLIEQAELDYPWGTMSVEQEFDTVNGFIVLREQHASVNRLNARLTVRYNDYWFAGED